MDPDQAARAVLVGKKAFAENDLAKAMKFFTKALAIDPGNREAQTLLMAVKKAASDPRPSSSSSRSAPSSSSSAASPNASPASEDHVVHVRRIMACRTYYEMLGVRKECSENDLKKAYRKASLKVHPDKNSAPGAVQAFQKVTEAFDVLSDERKKEIYDQVGHEQYTERARTGGAAGPAGADVFNGFQGQHVSAEDIFRAFFANNGRGGGFHFQTGGVRVNRNFNGTRGGGGGGVGGQPQGSWLTFIPILFVILVWLSGSFFSQQPSFLLHQSAYYPVARHTLSKEKLEYFTARDFDQRHPTRDDVLRVEREVRGEWARVYELYCSRERQERASSLAWTFSAEKRRRLEAQPMVHCEMLQRVRQDVVTGR